MTDEAQASREIGARLRSVRAQQGLSLADVEERSHGRFKAVVIGAYERGDRAVTISRLHRLADFYRVPMSALLEDPEPEPSASVSVVLDLVALERGAEGPGETVARFAERVQDQRGDHNGRVLSLRRSDIEAIALTVGLSRTELLSYLETRALARTHGS